MRLNQVFWLTLVWVLLWGDFTWGNVVNGILLAVGISLVFPLPAVKNRFHVRPLALIHLLARFLYDVVVASFRIGWLILTRRRPECAIVRIQTRSHNDLYLTATAGLTTLVPGSVAVDALPYQGILYVHVLDVDPQDPEESIERFCSGVLAQEERVMRAIATNDELRRAGYAPGWRCGKEIHD